MKYLFLFICLLLKALVFGQTFYTDLYGFKLGQYREAVKLEMGTPIQYGKFDDGFIYEVYLLRPDTSFYIAFEYSTADTNIIWSIQVSGKNEMADLKFGQARLGLDKARIENLYGKATGIEEIGEYGQKWVYDKTNMSLEVNTEGKLSSVKIIDNSSELFPEPDPAKLPTFEKIKKTLSSKKNSEILNLFCGDAEIYLGQETLFFKKSFKVEETTDYSKMLATIREISKDLSTVDTKNIDEYEENMRLSLGQDIKHVIKIKKGHRIKEIVFRYYGGQYLIYEISTGNK